MKFSQMDPVDAFAQAPYLPKTAFIGTNFIVSDCKAVEENDSVYMEVTFKATKASVFTKYDGTIIPAVDGVEHKYRFYPASEATASGAEGEQEQAKKNASFMKRLQQLLCIWITTEQFSQMQKKGEFDLNGSWLEWLTVMADRIKKRVNEGKKVTIKFPVNEKGFPQIPNYVPCICLTGSANEALLVFTDFDRKVGLDTETGSNGGTYTPPGGDASGSESDDLPF